MGGLTAEQAITLRDAVAIPSLHAEHRVTESVIATIPHEAVDYAPDAISRSAIELAWHIVTAEQRWLTAVIAGAFDFTPHPKPETIRTGSDVNAWYAPRFVENVRRLAELSGDQLARLVDFRGMFQFPAVIYIDLALHHTIHHRGQLSTYFRPMGAKVPSIYGESYDARIAREQAATR